MDEKYRLVFRGEILEGQHKAVVKRRLGAALQLDEPRMENLFSGNSIVLKRDVDRTTAARYQEVFKQAGGRLRVLVDRPSAPEPAAAQPDVRPEAPPAPVASVTELRELSVEPPYFPPAAAEAPEIQAPEFGLAEVGADLLDPVEEQPVIVAEPDFELAEVGSDMLEDRPEVVAVQLGPLEFEVAEVGATLGTAMPDDQLAAPDVSHLKLLEL